MSRFAQSRTLWLRLLSFKVDAMFKLGHLHNDKWGEHSHRPFFSHLKTNDGMDRIIATAPGGDPLIFLSLIKHLTDPLFLLYVLHTPRGEAPSGRYQSPELTSGTVAAFVTQFACFLQADARFDLWVHSPAEGATVVWDRHNLIHVYGLTAPATETLRSLGFHSGNPTIPSPHQHHYHAALDQDAKALIAYFDWRFSPLQPADEQ